MQGTRLSLACLAGVFAVSRLMTGQGVDSKDGIFQMEGNATSDNFVCFQASTGTGSTITNPGLAPPDASGNCPAGFTKVVFTTTNDWANLGTPNASTGIVGDKTNSNTDDIFTGGSSKDIFDISQWLWKGGKPQGKDDIAHAFAAAYTMPGTGPSAGHTIIVTGLDRYDNSGSSTAGFWFMQDSTIALNNNAGGGASGGFNGGHLDGDILIVSDFTTGGAVSNISVYKWVGNGTSGSLQFQEGISNGNVTCNPIAGTNSFCGIANPITVSSPWPFSDKSGSSNQFLHGEFLEIAIDLNAIFPTKSPCFTTFMAETRSSNSPSATLSDFTPPHSFPLCGISITKTCAGSGIVSNDGNSILYTWTGTVKNIGGGALFNPTVSDTLPDNSAAAPIVYTDTTYTTPLTQLAAKGQPGDTGFYKVTFTATASNVPNPLSVTNTANATAAIGSSAGSATVTTQTPGQDTCTTSPSGSVSIVKVCGQPFVAPPGPTLTTPGFVPGTTLSASGGVVAAFVNFSAQVCNAGTAGTSPSISGITVQDTPASLSSLVLNSQADGKGTTVTSLAPGTCAYVVGSYKPSAIDSTSNGLTNGRYTFSDSIAVTSATASFGTLTPATGCNGNLACSAATCAICFGGSCTQ